MPHTFSPASIYPAQVQRFGDGAVVITLPDRRRRSILCPDPAGRGAHLKRPRFTVWPEVKTFRPEFSSRGRDTACH